MASTHPDQEQSQPYIVSRNNKIEAVAVSLLILLVVAVCIGSIVDIVNNKLVHDKPIRCSVELVGAKGLGSALAPGAESPAFKLLVHVDNGRYFGLRDNGSDVVVSYAGVPLARGRTPAISLETKEAVTVEVDATSYGVGIPEDLFHLMSAERRSGVAQLEVDLWLRGLFTCNVELDGQQHSSRCYEPKFIYST
ncbi:hypothetical protein ACP70R_038187 [Stipagrostis hirtigluma subsp. patula]